MIDIAHAATVMVAELAIIIKTELVIDIEERVFEFKVAPVLSELRSDTETVFIMLFKFAKARTFFEECCPIQYGIEVSRTQMNGTAKRAHFIQVGGHAPHTVPDDADDTDRRLFAVSTNVDNAPLAAFFFCRIVDNAHLDFFIHMRSVHTGRHLNSRICGIVNTRNDLRFCSKRRIHASRDLQIRGLGIIDARRDLHTIKRIGSDVNDTDLRSRRLVLCQVQSRTDLNTI